MSQVPALSAPASGWVLPDGFHGGKRSLDSCMGYFVGVGAAVEVGVVAGEGVHVDCVHAESDEDRDRQRPVRSLRSAEDA